MWCMGKTNSWQVTRPANKMQQQNSVNAAFVSKIQGCPNCCGESVYPLATRKTMLKPVHKLNTINVRKGRKGNCEPWSRSSSAVWSRENVLICAWRAICLSVVSHTSSQCDRREAMKAESDSGAEQSWADVRKVPAAIFQTQTVLEWHVKKKKIVSLLRTAWLT